MRQHNHSITSYYVSLTETFVKVFIIRYQYLICLLLSVIKCYSDVSDDLLHRNDSQLFLLLHALYRLLPDDVVILPANQKGRNTLLRTTEVLNSLRTEITFAARAARDLLRGSKKEQPAGKIEDVQQELKRLKEQLLAVDGHVCEGENFAQFKVKLEKLQSLTDGAVINLCEAATQISWRNDYSCFNVH